MSVAKVIKEFDDDRKKEADPVKYKNLLGAVKSWMDAWPPQSTYTDVLRASSIYFVCPREFVLNYWQPTANRDFSHKSYLFMSTGTHLHKYLQDCILGPMGILWGDWLRDGKKAATGFHPSPEKALSNIVSQRGMEYEYDEIKCFDSDYRISGHVDGQISLRRIEFLHTHRLELKADPIAAMKLLRDLPHKDTDIVNLEIKTCGSYVFQNLMDSNSIPEYYKMQAEVYQNATGVRRTLFWYICRDTMESKLILYEYTGKWWKDATKKATIIWKAIRDETLPVSGMACHTPKDKRAKECTFRKQCFGEMDFTEYVRIGKERAKREGRTLLDLRSFKSDPGGSAI